MFGAICPCGFDPRAKGKSEDDRSIELSYLEALRAFWRIYWPMQLAAASAFAFATGTQVDLLVAMILRGISLYLVVGRLVSRPYKGFLVLAQTPTTGEVSRRLTAQRRLDVWAFLIWRLIVAEVLAEILTVPANMVLGVMGFNAAGWLTVGGFVLVSGPILLKMLIGQPFDDFMLIARRNSEVKSAEAAISHAS